MNLLLACACSMHYSRMYLMRGRPAGGQ